MIHMLSESEIIQRWLDYGIDLGYRTIYLGSSEYNKDGEETGTDFKMVESCIKNLHLLEKFSGNIHIVMNNLGGDLYHALAIYDRLRSSPSYIYMYNYGYCMSAGSIIMQAADTRKMAANSRMMVHYGEISTDGHGPSSVSYHEELRRCYKWMEDLYLERITQAKPKFTRTRLVRLMSSDWYLTAEEALEYNLIDEII